jgi:ankyrin repeat protein
VLKFLQILYLIFIIKIIFKASTYGETQKVDYLLLHGANVNATNNKKKTPLHHGNIRWGLFFKFQISFFLFKAANAEIIDLLVQHGADVNVKDIHGDTPLLLGKVIIVKFVDII